MILNGFWQVFLVGCAGGFSVEILKWYRVREKKKFPIYSKKASYWVITALMVILGGFLTILYGVSDVKALLAFNIGVTAPLIISTIANTIPLEKPKERGVLKEDQELGLIGFFRI